VQHKDAEETRGALRSSAATCRAHQDDRDEPNAHCEENRVAARAGKSRRAGAKALADLKHPPVGSKAQQRYETARAANTPAARQAVLADFVAANDDWTKSR
jgi:hypothetical protein